MQLFLECIVPAMDEKKAKIQPAVLNIN